MGSIHLPALLFQTHYIFTYHLPPIICDLLFSGVTLVPAIFKLLKDIKVPDDEALQTKTNKAMQGLAKFLDVASITCQLAGLIVWPLINSRLEGNNKVQNVWAFPVGMVLTSFGWWESFVAENSRIPLIRHLWQIKRMMIEMKTRYVVYLFVTVWKILLFLGLFIASTAALNNVSDVAVLFDYSTSSFNESTGYHITGTSTTQVDNSTSSTGQPQLEQHLPSKIVTVQVLCTLVAYMFGKFACKFNIQVVAFALPTALVMPATLATVLGLCQVRSNNPCAYENSHLPNHLFFQCPIDSTSQFTISNIFFGLNGWVWILMFLSQCWIARHIWRPKSLRLASTEQLFGNIKNIK